MHKTQYACIVDRSSFFFLLSLYFVICFFSRISSSLYHYFGEWFFSDFFYYSLITVVSTLTEYSDTIEDRVQYTNITWVWVVKTTIWRIHLFRSVVGSEKTQLEVITRNVNFFRFKYYSNTFFRYFQVRCDN